MRFRKLPQFAFRTHRVWVLGLVVALAMIVSACSGEVKPEATAPMAPSGVAEQSAADQGAGRFQPRASVTPTVFSGNPSCSSLNPEWLEIKFDPNPEGAGPFTQGPITITDASEFIFDWSSTLGIDAVIVKAGAGGNLYSYSPEATSDTDLIPPGQNAISHISFCYDINLEVTKTAVTTFNRDFDWTISKTVDQTSVTLDPGQSVTLNYGVVVTKSSAQDSGWSVSGQITIHNPHPSATATNVVVSDTITGIGSVTVNCGGVTSIAPGGTLVCSYSTALPDATSRTNTATATATGVPGGSGSADVIFGAPTNVTDNCVNVSDTYAGGPNENLCVSKTYNYSRTINASDLECGLNDIDNTAAIATDDGATKQSSANIDITRTCTGELFQACSPGYWGATRGRTGQLVHGDSWPIPTNTLFTAYFNLPAGKPANWTLNNALQQPGSTLNNAAFIGTAALLSALHGDVNYQYSVAEIQAAVNAALAGTPNSVSPSIFDLAATFGPDHVCPLN